MRQWTLFSWYFLGIGIVLGAHWAYLELGWGGYWAWDPVENASFIPWLTSTALIHTLILQKRRGLLKLWNIFLSILTFSLCIFGTFITRSGIIASVHAFGQSSIGYYFLTFLAIVFVGTGGLMIHRWKNLRSYSEEDSLLSKEGSFFVTNQIFMGLSFAIFLGTMYPFFSEFFTGTKMTTDTSASFFNRISVPVGLVLVGADGDMPANPLEETITECSWETVFDSSQYCSCWHGSSVRVWPKTPHCLAHVWSWFLCDYNDL